VLPVTPLADEIIRDLRARTRGEHYLFIAQRNVRCDWRRCRRSSRDRRAHGRGLHRDGAVQAVRPPTHL